MLSNPILLAADRYPVAYEESFNTVLVQEVLRYNKLLATVTQSLQDLVRAVQGLVVMSAALEAVADSLAANAVPQQWASKAYPSLKPLGEGRDSGLKSVTRGSRGIKLLDQLIILLVELEGGSRLGASERKIGVLPDPRPRVRLTGKPRTYLHEAVPDGVPLTACS